MTAHPETAHPVTVHPETAHSDTLPSGTTHAGSFHPGSFHPDRPYRLSPAVVLRPEPFGALAYHFGQRRLTYLAAADLVDVVSTLAVQPSAAVAMTAVGVSESRRPVLERALAGLLDRGVLDAA